MQTSENITCKFDNFKIYKCKFSNIRNKTRT